MKPRPSASKTSTPFGLCSLSLSLCSSMHYYLSASFSACYSLVKRRAKNYRAHVVGQSPLLMSALSHSKWVNDMTDAESIHRRMQSCATASSLRRLCELAIAVVEVVLTTIKLPSHCPPHSILLYSVCTLYTLYTHSVDVYR